MTEVMQDIKVDDVFHVRYTEAYRKEHGTRDLHHCFEGLAIARKEGDQIILVDTYWGLSGGSYSKIFYLKDIGRKIDIEYYCNLTEITKIENYKISYYADEDIIFLHNQHACTESCKYYFIKKGAVRSKEKMIQTLQEHISEAERSINSEKRTIEWKMKTLQEIENGKPLDEIYI